MTLTRERIQRIRRNWSDLTSDEVDALCEIALHAAESFVRRADREKARDAVLEAISKAGAFSAEIPCAVTVHFEYGPDAWDLLHSLHAFKPFLGSRIQK